MSTPITDITGIGPAAAATLAKHGFDSADAIASSDVESLCSVPGFGVVRAQGVIQAAKAIASIDKKKVKKPKGKSQATKKTKSPKPKDKKKGNKKSKSKPSKKSKKDKKKSAKKKVSKKSKSKKKGKGKK